MEMAADDACEEQKCCTLLLRHDCSEDAEAGCDVMSGEVEMPQPDVARSTRVSAPKFAGKGAVPQCGFQSLQLLRNKLWATHAGKIRVEEEAFWKSQSPPRSRRQGGHASMCPQSQ